MASLAPRLARDYSRIDYAFYHDPETYRMEQERIFRGPVWNVLGLEAEVPNPGDFRVTYVGDTPVVFNRDKDGKLNAFVNRCAHRGAEVVRKVCGNASDHLCIYHAWSYNNQGDLIGVPFQKGIKGLGGMPDSFDPKEHGLTKLRVAAWKGLIFGTFQDRTEPLESYLGELIVDHVGEIFSRQVKILGYQRQRIGGNWKLYAENTRDAYHGSLLHEFNRTFGLSRLTQVSGGYMDGSHRHTLLFQYAGSDDDTEARAAYSQDRVQRGSYMTLNDRDIVTTVKENRRGITTRIMSLFPNAVVHQVSNSLGLRRIRTFGPGQVEVLFTLFGYEDDDAEMTRHRLNQVNMVGPAGFISMEDGEAIELVQRSTARALQESAVVEMGGIGPIVDLDTRVNEIPIRGMWQNYAELMGIAPRRGRPLIEAINVKALVDDLVCKSALFIDRDDLDSWLACFDDDGSYEVIPRENLELNLPAAVMHAPTKAALIDRIVCLRHANKFNLHYDRHIVSAPLVGAIAGDIVESEANFLVVQTNLTGESRLFAVGCYLDKIRISGDHAKFVERRVILDSFAVPTLLATPL